MLKEQDVDKLLDWCAETTEEWFWIGARGAVRIAKRHKPMIKEAIVDIKNLVDFLHEKL